MNVSLSSVLCRPCLRSAGSSRAATAAAASAAAVTAAAGSVNPNLPRAKSRSTTSLQRIWRHSCSQMKGVGKKKPMVRYLERPSVSDPALVGEQRRLCRDQRSSRVVDGGEGIAVAQELRG